MKINIFKIIIIMKAFSILASSSIVSPLVTENTDLTVWNAPEGTLSNSTYSVWVRKLGSEEWINLFVYNVKIGHQSKNDPLMKMGKIKFRGPVNTSMVNFDFSGFVEVKIIYNKGKLKEFVFLPLSYQIKSYNKGNTIIFKLKQNQEAPKKIVLRVNGNWEEDCLHILTNPPEKNAPKLTDDNVYVINTNQYIPRVLPEGKSVYYFMPGTHKLPRGLWVDYDLGSEMSIDKMDLIGKKNRKGIDWGCQNFRLEYRTRKNEKWKVACEKLKNNQRNIIGLQFPAVKGRYFRLILLGNTNLKRFKNAWIHANLIRTFRLYTPTSEKDVATGNAIDGAIQKFHCLNGLYKQSEYGHLHSAETFFIARNGYTIYLAPGAILKGSIGAEKKEHISIKGRGIIDGSSLLHHPASLETGKSSVIECKNGNGILVEGITVLDSPCWGIVLNGNKNAVVRHINFFGSIVNADGIHMSAVQNGLVDGCFIRTTDDLFCVYHYGPARNIVFENCVLWSDGGRIILLGFGKNKGNIENLSFQNLDILNVQNVWSLEDHGGAIYIRATSGNFIRGICFNEIRFEKFRASKIASVLNIFARSISVGGSPWFSAGNVRDISFENVTYPGKGEAISTIWGEDKDHTVKNVSFKNVMWGEEKLTSTNHPLLIISNYVSKVEFSKQAKIVAEIKPFKGTPMLYINGNCMPFLSFFGNIGDVSLKNREITYQEMKMAADVAGIHIHSMNLQYPWKIGDCYYSENIKQKLKKYDYSDFDSCMHRALESDTNALLVPRLWIGPPNPLALEKYKGEKITFNDGTKKHVSLGSKKWIRDASNNLRALIRHINQSNYGNSVIAYHITYLDGGEWFYSNGSDKFTDFSKVYHEAFREYLINKYGTTKKLRKAWKDNNVTFDKVTVPTIEERTKADMGFFHTANLGRFVMDFYEFHNEKVAETITHFAKIVKEETDNRCLTIFAYGYLFELNCNFPFGSQNSGHNALKKVLECPEVDMLMSPLSYYERWNNAEKGGAYYMGPVDSIHLNNKLCLNEDDTRTHLAKKDWNNFDKAKDIQSSLNIIRKNFANMLIHSAACWWMDLPAEGWWNQKEIWEEIKNLKKIYEKWMSVSTSCAFEPEIAVIIDEKSMLTQSANNELMRLLLYRGRHSLSLIGAPCGFYLLSDLADDKVPNAKLYIFLNTFDVNEKERKYIDKHIKIVGKTLVWLYGAGFMKEGIPNIKNIESLTGMKMGIQNKKMLAETLISERKIHPIVDELQIRKFGKVMDGFEVNPVFYIDDTNTVVLGKYKQNNKPSFGVKNINGASSIFIGTPKLSHEVLISICKYAGVHLYSEKGTEMIFARDNFIGIYSEKGGERTIYLPEQGNVYDLIRKKTVKKNAKKFIVKMNKHETKLFAIGWQTD